MSKTKEIREINGDILTKNSRKFKRGDRVVLFDKHYGTVLNYKMGLLFVGVQVKFDNPEIDKKRGGFGRYIYSEKCFKKAR